ncbi:MAG: hypothetical protein LBU36_08880 [Clostridiales bacterium]|nr:hypothetical protein [Clostridiales bacterium]
MTKAQVIKTAAQGRINIDMVAVKARRGVVEIEMAELPPDVIKRNLESGDDFRNTEEVERLINKYNKQARKLVGLLKTHGLTFRGFRRGSGDWDYTTRAATYSDYLVASNID